MGSAVLLLVLTAVGCAPKQRTPAVAVPLPETVILPERKKEQFRSAVETLKEEVARTLAVSTPEYSGIQVSLQYLAVAIQTMPRAEEELVSIEPANAIRDDATRIGGRVLDDPARTVAAKRALVTATETLERVAAGVYRDVPLAPLIDDLRRTVDAIDASRVLAREQARVIRAFQNTVAILEEIERAA